MPSRRVPPMLVSYLGSVREPEGPVEHVLNQCELAHLEGDSRLSDYDPLVVVMDLVAAEVRGLRLSPRGPKGSAVWIEVLEKLQDAGPLTSIGHNRFVPCRSCNRAFRPLIDRHLLKLFLAWQESGLVEDLLAIHRCQRCGGTIIELEARTYAGDMHTPAPGSHDDDETWVRELLAESGLYDLDAP